MRFKPPKASDWFAEYAWLGFPEVLQSAASEGSSRRGPAAAANADLSSVGVKENRQMNGGSGSARSASKSNLKKRAGSAAKSVKFDQ